MARKKEMKVAKLPSDRTLLRRDKNEVYELFAYMATRCICGHLKYIDCVCQHCSDESGYVHPELSHPFDP